MGMFDTKKGNNTCPNCGASILGGMKECPKCHYDFALGKVSEEYIKRTTEQRLKEEAEAEEYRVKKEAEAEEYRVKKEAEAEENRLRQEKLRLIEEQKEEAKVNYAKNKASFKTTTGFGFEGYKIVKHYNVQRGVCILGTGFLSETSAAVSDIFGSSSTSMENKLKQAQNAAFSDLIRECARLGANAAIGVDIDIMTLANNMLVASAIGTAVYIEKE